MHIKPVAEFHHQASRRGETPLLLPQKMTDFPQMNVIKAQCHLRFPFRFHVSTKFAVSTYVP